MKRAGIGVALALILAPVQVSAQTYSRTEVIEYHDNLAHWVLGQTAKVTCVAPAECKPASAPNGIVMSQTDYDTLARPIRTYSFGKLQQTLSYDSTSTITSGQLGTLKTVSDGRDGVSGAETTITLSNWKRGIPQSIKYPITTESPTGATESAVVNDDGTIASVTDENGYKTCYAYDAMGRLASITYPSETLSGVCESIEETAGAAWAKTTQSFQQVATPEYGIAAGHWKQTISTGNARKVVYFDAMWRPLVEESYDNASPSTTRSVTVKRYDSSGHLAFQSYPVASLTDYASTALTGTDTFYDALDRVTRVEQDSELGALTTTTEYQTGFKVKVTNPRNYATTTSYMTYDQPTMDWPVAIVHPEGAYTHITRDVFGKPTKLRRSNSSDPTAGTVALDRIYTYNSNQELCRTDEPETGSTFMGYDASGNLAWSASGYTGAAAGCVAATSVAARRADRTYDNRNRLSSLSFPDGLGNQTWAYAPDGLPASITTDNSDGGLQVVNAYTYNRRRLLIDESVGQPGWYTWHMVYGYNANGHLSSLKYPNTTTVSLAPNALGQPTQVGTYATDASYFPNGALKQFTYGNGIVHTLTQNTRGLPDTSKDAYGTTSFLNDGYDYDANGNVSAITDGATGTGQRGNRTMTYDGLDRLKATVSAMYGTTGANYTYDVLDNLTRVNLGGAAARNHYYCYDATTWRLTFLRSGPVCTGASASTAVGSLQYDVQGNLDNKDGQNYDFDYGNRLRTVTDKETYRYDGHGRRVQASHPTKGNIVSLYSQSGQLMYHSDYRTGIGNVHLYLGGSLIAIREQPVAGGTAVVKYQHTDALGSPVLVTDSARNPVGVRNEYEPYGKVIAPASPKDGPGYTGHVFDSATGMNYMQQRYYDPGIGRFLSVDPVTAHSSAGDNFNRYWYASNNPYRFFDPDGREDEEKHVRPDRRSLDSCLSCRGANGSSVSLHGEGGKKRSDAQSSNAERAGPGSVFASSAAASEAGDDFVTELNGGPLLDALFGDPYLVNVVPVGDAFTYTLTPINAGMPPAVGLRGASIGSTVFRTAHYASRLEAAGLNVARTQTIIAREVARIRQNLAIGADVVGRMRVNGVLIEYRMRALPNGNVNVGTIFPVK